MSFYSDEELKRIGFKSIGKNVKISRKCSIYCPETISIGSHVRIDDFCVLSGGEGGIHLGSFIHLAIFSAIFGGGGVTLEDFTCLSSRVIVYSAMDDASGMSLTNPTVPRKYLKIMKGEVMISKHAGVGTNSTVFPSVTIGAGTVVGAHSLVNKDLDPWGIYAGVPARRLKERKKDVLQLEEQVWLDVKGGI